MKYYWVDLSSFQIEAKDKTDAYNKALELLKHKTMIETDIEITDVTEA